MVMQLHSHVQNSLYMNVRYGAAARGATVVDLGFGWQL